MNRASGIAMQAICDNSGTRLRLEHRNLVRNIGHSWEVFSEALENTF